MSPDKSSGEDPQISTSLLHLPTEKADRDKRVRRVYDPKEMEAYCKRLILEKEGIDLDNPQEKDRVAVEKARQGIGTICRDMRERIYWGVYNDWSELQRLSEIAEIEQLTGEDAFPYQKLLCKGLKEDQPAFGAKYDDEIIKLELDENGKPNRIKPEHVEKLESFINDRYVIGVKYIYLTADGEPKERIVGFGLLERKGGSESHKGYAGRLYVHKAHQGRGIARSILLHLFDQADKLGLKHVDAVVVASNKWLREWYRRIGFRDMRTEYDAVEIDGTSYDWVHIRLNMEEYRQNRPKL